MPYVQGRTSRLHELRRTALFHQHVQMPAAQLASQADAAPFVGPAAGAASVSADLHGRHASRSSLRPRLRSSRRLARRRAVGTVKGRAA